MDKSQALQLWTQYYGDNLVAYDYASQMMRRDDFEDEKSKYSWTIDYIKPQSLGGLNISSNLIPCNVVTKNVRQNKMSFKIGNGLFEVRKSKEDYKRYILCDATDRLNPLDLTPNTQNQDPEFNHLRQQKLYGKVNEERFVLPSLDDVKNNVLNKNAPDIMNYMHVETEEHVEENSKVETVNKVEEKHNEDNSVDDVFAAYLQQDINDEIKEENNNIEEPQIIKLPDEVENTEKVDSSLNETLKEESKTYFGPFTSTDEIYNIINKNKEELSKNLDADGLLNVMDNLVNENKNLISSLTEENKLHKELKEDKQNSLEREAIKDQTIQTQQKTLNNLYRSLDEVKAEKEKIEVELESYKSQNDIYLEQKNKLEKDIEALNNEIENKNNLISTLTESSKNGDVLNSELQDIQNQKQKLIEELENLKIENRNLTLEKEQLINNNNDLSQKINDLNNQISSLKEEIEINKVSLSETNNDLLNEANDKSRLQSLLSSNSQELELSKQDNKTKQQEIENLKKEIEELDTQVENLNNQISNFDSSISLKENEIASLKETISNLNREKEELEESDKLKDDQYKSVDFDYSNLKKEYDDLNDQYKAVCDENENLSNQKISDDKTFNDLQDSLLSLQNELRDKENKILSLEGEKKSIANEKENLYEKVTTLSIASSDMSKELEKLKKEKVDLETEKSQSLENITTALNSLRLQKDKLDKKYLFILCGGDINSYDQFEFYMSDSNISINEDNTNTALLSHPLWRRRDDNRIYSIAAPITSQEEGIKENNINATQISVENVSFVETQKHSRNKALSYWAIKFSEDLDESTDFAGRIIRKRNFNDKDSDYAWGYRLINDDDREFPGNIVIANLRTLADFDAKNSFTTNGQKFRVLKEKGEYKIISDEYITDPYNLEANMKVVKNIVNQTSPLIYIFTKVIGTNNSEVDESKVMEFLTLIDRTVKRICPKSFIEMKIVSASKKNYAFMTFDGTIDGAYKEALDYATLLNSYRNEFKNEKNGLNAYIVIDQLDVPYSMRHFTFEQMVLHSKNVAIRAVQYEFTQTAVVDTSISKTIHIGPNIINNLSIDQTSLKDSKIGHSSMFSNIYTFKDHFKIYNYIYSLNRINLE